MMETDPVSRSAGANAPYCQRPFAAIRSRSGPVFRLNPAAAILGPVWAGMRGLSLVFLPLCVLDLLALSHFAAGLTTFPAEVSLAQSAPWSKLSKPFWSARPGP